MKKTVSARESKSARIVSYLQGCGLLSPCDGSSASRRTQKAYHNTLILLANYREILWQTTCEIDTISFDLNLPVTNLDVLVSRIDAEIGMSNKRLENQLERLSKTQKLLDRVNDSLCILKSKPGNGSILYDVIYLTYISEERYKQEEVQELLHISRRHYYRLKEEAISTLSIRL